MPIIILRSEIEISKTTHTMNNGPLNLNTLRNRNRLHKSIQFRPKIILETVQLSMTLLKYSIPIFKFYQKSIPILFYSAVNIGYTVCTKCQQHL